MKLFLFLVLAFFLVLAVDGRKTPKPPKTPKVTEEEQKEKSEVDQNVEKWIKDYIDKITGWLVHFEQLGFKVPQDPNATKKTTDERDRVKQFVKDNKKKFRDLAEVFEDLGFKLPGLEVLPFQGKILKKFFPSWFEESR